MISLNIGNVWSESFLDRVVELNKTHDDIKVTSMFGSIASFTPSARPLNRLPDRSEGFIESYIRKARKNNIDIRWTLNQSCLGSIQSFKDKWINGLQSNIVMLDDFGVTEWTIMSPLLVELVRKTLPNTYIEMSTIAEVDSVEKLKRYMELGANSANVSTSINRNFSLLQDMAKINKDISILVNEACLFECPWRAECYNLSSHDSYRGPEYFTNYPFNRCNTARIKNPVEWVKSRIVLPQWLDYYTDITSIARFKVAFRTHPEEVALPMLETYMDKNFDGNLLKLWPTVAQLAKTDEPQLLTNISCTKLDSYKHGVSGCAGFLEWFIEGGCKADKTGTGCGECGYCSKAYAFSQK